MLQYCLSAQQIFNALEQNLILDSTYYHACLPSIINYRQFNVNLYPLAYYFLFYDTLRLFVCSWSHC